MDNIIIKPVSDAEGLKALDGLLREIIPDPKEREEYILWMSRPIKIDLQGFAYRCDESGRRLYGPVYPRTPKK